MYKHTYLDMIRYQAFVAPSAYQGWDWPTHLVPTNLKPDPQPVPEPVLLIRVEIDQLNRFQSIWKPDPTKTHWSATRTWTRVAYPAWDWPIDPVTKNLKTGQNTWIRNPYLNQVCVSGMRLTNWSDSNKSENRRKHPDQQPRTWTRFAYPA